jgi:ligand-binding sensor domain-containing protein
MPAQWGAFGMADGVTDSVLLSLDWRSDGVLAIGSQNSGVYWYRPGPDLFDKSDDVVTQFREDNSFIPSDNVNVVRFSPDDELWVATNFGVARLDERLGRIGEIGRFVDIVLPAGFGPDVRAMEFDRRGNVWLGSFNGMVRYETSAGTFEHFTTINSGLLSDTVNSLTLDTVNGDLYIGTPAGISVQLSATGVLTDKIDSVLAYPNPFIIRSGTERLQFNIAAKYTVSVYTLAGELVWEVDELSDRSWDGNNLAGKPVASGVYLFVLEDADGRIARGKFLLVRE